MMKQYLTVEEIEKIAHKAGISISQLCRDARIARSTFRRWKAGETEPSMRNYKKITGVLMDNGLTTGSLNN